MEVNNEPINIFDFDGTLTTETWPKFWVWVKKFGYSGEKRNDNLESALADYRNGSTLSNILQRQKSKSEFSEEEEFVR